MVSQVKYATQVNDYAIICVLIIKRLDSDEEACINAAIHAV